jgi:hypothetical protein
MASPSSGISSEPLSSTNRSICRSNRGLSAKPTRARFSSALRSMREARDGSSWFLAGSATSFPRLAKRGQPAVDLGQVERLGRERARPEIAVIRVLEKRLGALPVVAEFGRRLRIAEIVDELCPVRPVAWITHGEVIEALVANRLTAPAPLVRVQDWAAAMAVEEEAYGIAPELLNDDRIARALDAVAPQLEAIAGGVGAAAVTEFGVDVSRLHWDLTSISLYGAYPEADEEYPAPRWGHPKDRRADLKQIQTGLAVSGDGGIPVFHRPYSGGAAEVAQVAGAMTALKQIAGPRPFLLVGDSKLISLRTRRR